MPQDQTLTLSIRDTHQLGASDPIICKGKSNSGGVVTFEKVSGSGPFTEGFIALPNAAGSYVIRASVAGFTDAYGTEWNAIQEDVTVTVTDGTYYPRVDKIAQNQRVIENVESAIEQLQSIPLIDRNRIGMTITNGSAELVVNDQKISFNSKWLAERFIQHVDSWLESVLPDLQNLQDGFVTDLKTIDPS